MAPRRRTLLLSAALGLAVVGQVAVPGQAGAAPVQEFTPSSTSVVGQIPASTSELGQVATSAPSTEGTQTVVETEPQRDQRLVSESRRILAVIAALIIVAITLALLTVRYWRITKPVPLEAGAAPPAPAAAKHAAPSRSRRSRRSVAGADHAGADDDWEPRGTGEQAAVPSGAPALARPPAAARRRALGLTADA